MHSFAYALIAAALATAAPVPLPPIGLAVSTSVPLSTGVPSVPLPIGAIHSVDEGEVKSTTGAIRAREVDSMVTDAVKSIKSKTSDIHVRAATPSVPVICTDISIEIQPYIEQLTYLVPSNCTITEITSIVSSIKASLTAAVPQLQALVGLEASVILAPADAAAGDAELTVSEVTGIVGADLNLILGATSHTLDVTNAKGGDIVADVKDVLTDLGCTVTSLVGAVVPLVSGLSASLAPVVASFDSVIADLNLGELDVLLGLSA